MASVLLTTSTCLLLGVSTFLLSRGIVIALQVSSFGLLPGLVTYFYGWVITPFQKSASPLARLVPKRKMGIPTEKENVAATVD